MLGAGRCYCIHNRYLILAYSILDEWILMTPTISTGIMNKFIESIFECLKDNTSDSILSLHILPSCIIPQ